MIGISTQTYDIDGAYIIRELGDSNVDAFSRRVNRVATLDGGAVVNDGGYAAGDRNLVVRWKPRTRAEYDAIRGLVQNYSLLTVCTRDGAYSAAPYTISLSGQDARLELYVKEALS